MSAFDAPSYDGGVGTADGMPALAQALRDRLESANGFVIVSPEYNALDPRRVADAIDRACWDDDLGEFILPYELVRTADDPDALLLAFRESTYEAAATTARWDRDALERPSGGHDRG
jgi:hypothetical protein